MNLPSEQEHAPQPPQTITAGEWIASKTAGSEQGRAGTGFALTSMSMPKRSEEHTSELQSLTNLVCRLLLEKKKHAPALRPGDRKTRLDHEPRVIWRPPP